MAIFDGRSQESDDPNATAGTTGEDQVVQVDETQVEDIPVIEDDPVQVQSETIVFVAQETFEGRINQETFRFQEGVRYEVTRDQANTWVDAGKGYTIEG